MATGRCRRRPRAERRRQPAANGPRHRRQVVGEQHPAVRTSAGRRVAIKWRCARRRRRLKGLCPFHDEKSPSFHVEGRGLFHCFGCGVGGDVIAFVQRTDGLSFAEAVERLADRAGVQLRYEQGGAAPSRPQGQRTRLVEANRLAAAFYAGQLAGPEAHVGRRLPDRPRLRRRGRRAVRLRLRTGRLGRAHRPPARPRLQPGRAGHRRAVPAVQPRLADRPVPPPAALADPGHLRATWSASAPAGCTTTTRSRPSTSTPRRRRSTTSRRCSTAPTSRRRRSPGAGRRSSSRATPT